MALFDKTILTIENIDIKQSTFNDRPKYLNKFFIEIKQNSCPRLFIDKNGLVEAYQYINECNRSNFYSDSLPDALKIVAKYLEKRPKTVEEKLALITKKFFDHVDDIKIRAPHNVINGDYRFENFRLQEIYDILKND
jgi:hypothetical protein